VLFLVNTTHILPSAEQSLALFTDNLYKIIVNSRFSTVWTSRSCAGALMITLLVLAACGRNDVQVYRVSKDQPDSQQTPQTNPSGMPPGHPDTAGQPAKLKWTLPAGWEEVVPGEMRVASFKIKGDGGKQADVSVVPLPGMAGGDLANVNRWRGQVGLSPVSEEEMGKLAEPIEIGGQKANLFDQAGQSGGSGEQSRILAAVLHQDDIAWFFKMTGDDAVVAQQKPAFVSFLKSLSFAAPAATPVAQDALPASHPPIDPGLLSAPALAATTSAEGKPAWQVPAGWQEVPAGQFLVAKFTIPGSATEPTAVNVSMSAGQGGGVSGNINRWRGQLGLGQLSDAEIDKLVAAVDTAAGKAMFVDMVGTDARSGQKARMLGAIVPQSNQTWFYKLMGDEQVVGREKDAFSKFVQTAKYP
jgi:hypothetical protein